MDTSTTFTAGGGFYCLPPNLQWKFQWFTTEWEFYIFSRIKNGVDVSIFYHCGALIKTLFTVDCGLEGTELRLSEVKLYLESSHNIA